jgi:hypothetical protein
MTVSAFTTRMPRKTGATENRDSPGLFWRKKPGQPWIFKIQGCPGFDAQNPGLSRFFNPGLSRFFNPVLMRKIQGCPGFSVRF